MYKEMMCGLKALFDCGTNSWRDQVPASATKCLQMLKVAGIWTVL